MLYMIVVTLIAGDVVIVTFVVSKLEPRCYYNPPKHEHLTISKNL